MCPKWHQKCHQYFAKQQKNYSSNTQLEILHFFPIAVCYFTIKIVLSTLHKSMLSAENNQTNQSDIHHVQLVNFHLTKTKMIQTGHQRVKFYHSKVSVSPAQSFPYPQSFSHSAGVDEFCLYLSLVFGGEPEGSHCRVLCLQPFINSFTIPYSSSPALLSSLSCLEKDYPLTYGFKKKVTRSIDEDCPWRGLSLADISLDGALAGFAGHVTAPVVFTLAALHQHLCVGIITPSTAHQPTALTAARRLVTLPAEKSDRQLFTYFKNKFNTNKIKVRVKSNFTMFMLLAHIAVL